MARYKQIDLKMSSEAFAAYGMAVARLGGRFNVSFNVNNSMAVYFESPLGIFVIGKDADSGTSYQRFHPNYDKEPEIVKQLIKNLKKYEKVA